MPSGSPEPNPEVVTGSSPDLTHDFSWPRSRAARVSHGGPHSTTLFSQVICGLPMFEPSSFAAGLGYPRTMHEHRFCPEGKIPKAI